MGADGALFVERHGAVLAIPPAIVVKSTVGAGDAMVAGIVTGTLRGLDLAGRARLATAFSLGTLGEVGPNLPTAPSSTPSRSGDDTIAGDRLRIEEEAQLANSSQSPPARRASPTA